ncbi:hypothetical protein [Methanobacterium ferruginis]|uniref:hypothetical protein n=1 Tax=Methanobacterium ferruginis TaxID=710191 RepID=UPI00257427EA|nr:hypothetical protein [Methanobacterium ferruginis]BDZ68627.1 hypothetical protein GCM10025860_20750 [Methanobacterium ferruginis]
MQKSKKLLALLLGLAMILGVTPAFAEEPYASGTSEASVGVLDTVSIVVSGDVSWSDLYANNVLTSAQQTRITSHSNVPINVTIKGTDFASNLPLSALKFNNGTEDVDMSTSDQQAIGYLAAPEVEGDSYKDMDLKVQVPFGVLTNSYSTTLTWTASAA